MIEFSPRYRDPLHVPVVSDDYIRRYAETLVGDFKPELLRVPQKINALRFIENYLGAQVEYHTLYNQDKNKGICGLTLFDWDTITVMEPEKRVILVGPDTIVINVPLQAGSVYDRLVQSYTDPTFRTSELFTQLHEAGHYCMHRPVYTAGRAAPCPAKEHNPVPRLAGGHDYGTVKSAAAGTAESPATARGGNDRIAPEAAAAARAVRTCEHQANVFAAAAAMPRQTFIPFAVEAIREAGFQNGVFIMPDAFNEPENGPELWEADLLLQSVCGKIGDVFGVSMPTAEIHLRTLGLLRDIGKRRG